jgi:alanine dehydrogenase
MRGEKKKRGNRPTRSINTMQIKGETATANEDKVIERVSWGWGKKFREKKTAKKNVPPTGVEPVTNGWQQILQSGVIPTTPQRVWTRGSLFESL